MKPLIVSLVLLVVLTGCGSSKPDTFDVFGTLVLSASGSLGLVGNGVEGTACTGSRGFDDIAQGAQVVVRDSTGKTVALGQLDAGQLTASITDDSVGAPCQFIIRIDGVKATSGSAFYSIEVAHRGQIQFTRPNAGNLALTLG
jgi:hypothetical protein